jgi:hypothetical protein
MPGSIADDFDLLEPGTRKFETLSATVHGLSEEAQINTGTLNGLGNRDYNLIDTEPQSMMRHVFALDQRPTGERFRAKFLKFTPFPYERYDGQGFLREQEVDTEFVKSWHGDGENGANGDVVGSPGAAEGARSGD